VHAKMAIAVRAQTDVNLKMHVITRDVHTTQPALSSMAKQHVLAWKDSKEMPKKDACPSGLVIRRNVLLMHRAMFETAKLSADATPDIEAMQMSNVTKSIPVKQSDVVPMHNALNFTTPDNADAKKATLETGQIAEHTEPNAIVSVLVFLLWSMDIISKIVKNHVPVTTERILALNMPWECAQVDATVIPWIVLKTISVS